MDTHHRILIVDDDEFQLSYLCDALSSKGYATSAVENIQDAKRVAEREPVDLLITDIRMREGSGIDLVRHFRSHFPAIPTIVISGFPGEEYINVLEEMEVDVFLTKPFSAEQIRYSVLKLLEKRRREIEHHGNGGEEQGDGDLGLIGTSQYIVNLRKKIHDIARGEFAVFIQGPSGTGKEIIANAIHNLSRRKENPIVTINCAAIPRHLEESEFFGFRKGAFTGAYRDKNGIIATADNSTLFLDEIAELTLEVQAKLLRVLENGEFIRVGETRPEKANIRIIAATNKDIKAMISQKLFREDLYFRLGIIINTRPLCEHKEDIPSLVRHCMHINRQESLKCPAQITSDAMALLVEHEWPGNVRQLKQTINLLSHTAQGKKRINSDDVKSVFQKKPGDAYGEASYLEEKGKIVHEFEIDYFTRLLKKYSGNISHAARTSGMHRPNLIKKLQSLGISPEEFRETA